MNRSITTRRLLIRNGKLAPAEDESRGAEFGIAPVSAHDLAYGLGGFALENGESRLALRWFDVVVGAEPASAVAHGGRVRALVQSGDWESAEIAFFRADERSASLPRVLLDESAVFTSRARSSSAKADDLARACSRAASAVAAPPGLSEAHFRLARSLPHGPTQLDALESAQRASPGVSEVALGLARALAREARVEEARRLGARLAGWVRGERRDRDVYDFLDDLPETPHGSAQPWRLSAGEGGARLRPC